MVAGVDPLLSQSAADLAVDARALDALKRTAERDPRAAIRKAAQQFEALFMQMVLKSMRDATPKSGLLDSPANEMYTGMLDQQLAGKIAASGTGLADLIAKQLENASGVGRRVSGVEQIPSGVGRPASGVSTASPSALREAPSPAPDARRPTPDVSRHFVTKVWDHALAAERATGVPARFIVGQAALESGWGQREMRASGGVPSHNLFGIKAGANWSGRTVDAVTTEYDHGVAKQVVQKFRAYDNYTEAFRDWAQLMAGNPRYAQVVVQGRSGDGRGFAYAMQRAGYATDPDYAAKLDRTIGAAQALRTTA